MSRRNAETEKSSVVAGMTRQMLQRWRHVAEHSIVAWLPPRKARSPSVDRCVAGTSNSGV